MAAILHQLDQRRLIDTNGIADGASIYFYTTGTLTPASVYTTAALSVEHSSPIVVAAGAAVPDIWLDSTVTYRRRIVYPDGSVDDTDPYTSGVLQATDLVSTAAGKGAAMAGYSAGGIGAIDDNVLNVLRMGAVNVMSFIPITERAAITAGTSTTDVTTYLQAALDAHIRVVFPDGFFKITDQLEPRAGQTIIMSPGTIIRQYTEGTPAFYALDKADLTFLCNGAQIYGPGVWDSTWTTTGDHLERGFFLIRCDDLVIDRPRLRNWGLAAISLAGCLRPTINLPDIKGTHTLGTPLVYGGNRQMAIYLYHGYPRGTDGTVTSCGPCDVVRIIAPEISEVCQGILSELEASNGSAEGEPPTVGIQIIEPSIHDVIGQHAFYLTTGGMTITNPRLKNIAGAGVKLASGQNSNDLTNVTVTGLTAADVGGNLIEMYNFTGYGKVKGVKIDGTGTRVGRAAAVGSATGDTAGGVENVRIDLVIEDANRADAPFNTGAAVPSTNFVAINGDVGESPSDLEINVSARDVREGLIISCPTRNTRISARINNDNLTGKTITGITKANPAVVTAAGHGFSNGDSVLITGVAGMTEVNAVAYTVASATTDTFALSGVDSSAYGAYTSGGKVALATQALRVNNQDAQVDFLDPDTTGWNFRYGLFAEMTSGATAEVRVLGSQHIRGAVQNVRDDQLTIKEGMWVSYTPTIASSSGSLTTVTRNSCRYRLDGDIVHVQLDFTLTDAGTGSGDLTASLPYTSKYNGAWGGRDTNSGNMISVSTLASNANAYFLGYTGSGIITTGARLVVGFSYERS